MTETPPIDAPIVFDALTVEPRDTFAFDVWYANHFLPQRMASGAFKSVRRYLSPIRASYLAVFEARAPLSAADAAGEAAHALVAARERFVGDPIGAKRAAGAGADVLDADILYPVFFRVPAEREREFDAWYEDEHLDLLLGSPYWPLCRRFRIRGAHPHGFTHLALHYLTDLRALESPERDRARSTPWRARLAAEAWFRGEYRVYYRWGRR